MPSAFKSATQRSRSEGTGNEPEAPARAELSQLETPVFKLRYLVNREEMAGTSPGRQSGETAKSVRHRVLKGRQADPHQISVVLSGLSGV